MAGKKRFTPKAHIWHNKRAKSKTFASDWRVGRGLSGGVYRDFTPTEFVQRCQLFLSRLMIDIGCVGTLSTAGVNDDVS